MSRPPRSFRLRELTGGSRALRDAEAADDDD
jgi:hypothetical protein